MKSRYIDGEDFKWNTDVAEMKNMDQTLKSKNVGWNSDEMWKSQMKCEIQMN